MHSPRNLADRSVRDCGVVQLVVLYWRSEVGDRARILIKSVMYAGARLWIARNVSTSNLYITRNRIGSQCTAIRTGVMWSRRRCRIIKIQQLYRLLVLSLKLKIRKYPSIHTNYIISHSTILQYNHNSSYAEKKY